MESVNFNKKVLILHESLKIDEINKKVKVVCNAYGNRKEEGIKIKLSNLLFNNKFFFNHFISVYNIYKIHSFRKISNINFNFWYRYN